MPAFPKKRSGGAVDATTAKTVADQTAAVFKAHPDISVVIAPYDEFARGVKLAADENKLKVKIYSADISTSDIEAIGAMAARGWPPPPPTRPLSVRSPCARWLLPWRATDPVHEIIVKPALVTQDELKKNNIKTLADLVAKVPASAPGDAAQAKWIPKP